MPLVVPRKVTFLAKSEYFTSPGLKGFIKKLTFIALGQVPVDRSGGRASEAALITGLRVLGRGDCIGIYATKAKVILTQNDESEIEEE